MLANHGSLEQMQVYGLKTVKQQMHLRKVVSSAVGATSGSASLNSSSSVSSRLSNKRSSTLYYGLVYGKHNQEDPVKCAKTRVIITRFSDQPLP